MYKVYLIKTKENEVNEDTSNEILNEIEKHLINLGNFVVFRSREKTLNDQAINEINMLNIDIFINIFNSSKERIICYPKKDCNLSNGFAKEIYKEIKKNYCYNTIENDVVYEHHMLETAHVKCPFVLIESGIKAQDAKLIGKCIGIGIENAFKLRPC